MRVTITWMLGLTILLSSATWALDPSQEPTFRVGDPAASNRADYLAQRQSCDQIRARSRLCCGVLGHLVPALHEGIPQLSELQKKYADRLTVVGINVEGLLGQDPPRAETVLDLMKRKSKEMAYTVAMEDLIKKTVSEDWITASGSIGIPTAFIIDKQGKLAWLGYPDRVQSYSFEQAVEDTLAGNIDLVRARTLQASASPGNGWLFQGTPRSEEVRTVVFIGTGNVLLLL